MAVVVVTATVVVVAVAVTVVFAFVIMHHEIQLQTQNHLRSHALSHIIRVPAYLRARSCVTVSFSLFVFVCVWFSTHVFLLRIKMCIIIAIFVVVCSARLLSRINK